jgi:RNA polymerase sigma-70 factor (ECF subfamily)
MMIAESVDNSVSFRRRKSLQDEKDMISECKNGSAYAWDLLIHTYEKLIFEYAYSMCHNYDDAADLAGQTYLRLFQNIHSFRNDSHFSSWLYRIERNIFLDTFVRSRKNSPLSIDEETCRNDSVVSHLSSASYASPEAESTKRMNAVIINNAIDHLPYRHRIMIEMYHTQGISYEEIAQITGLAIGTVKSRLSRARRMLRERLCLIEDILTIA